MKRKNIRNTILLAGAMAGCTLLTGCSTSAGQFAGEYFSEVSDYFSSGKSSSDAETVETDAAETIEQVQIEAPAEFTLSDEGEYSFSAVEGAAQYYIYLCDTDATEDTDDYLYATRIDADDTQDTISGELDFDYLYGEYLAKVYAVAEDNMFSAATVVNHVHSGEITTPRVAYSWDGEGSITFDVVNVTAYEYSGCPDVEILLTELSSGTETTILMEGVSDSAYLTQELEEGEYSMEAKGITDSEYVTNQTTDSYVITESVTLSGDEVSSDDFEIRATYTAPAMFLIDFTTDFDTNSESITYTWANVMTAEFTRDEEKEDDWTQYYFVGEGTGDDGLHAEVSFKADGTCRMIVRGGAYGGSMGGEQLAETGADGYEWVEATGSWSISEDGVITFTVS